MKKEYDFSNGERGKFFRPGSEIKLPIYLEPEISQFVDQLARERNVERSQIVNSLLRKDKEIIELS